MKKLRLFDSLKFVRAMFVAVVCAFVVVPAYAELRDSELPNGYKRLTDVVFDGNTYYETNQRLYGTDTLTVRLSNTNTSGQNVIGAFSGNGDSVRNFSLYVYGDGSSSDAYLRHGTIVSRPNYGTGARTLVIGPTGTSGFAENTTYSAETFETTSTFWIGGLPNSSSPKYTGNIVGNITVGDRLKYIPCERTSDGAIGYYETVNNVFLENQGSGTPTTSGYDDSHIISTNPISSTLPAGYTELEYIEGTGTQYIDTGYSPNTQNVKYVYSVQNTSTDTAERHPARIASGRIQIYRKSTVWNIYESSPTVSSSSIPNLGIMDKVDFVIENNYDNSLTILANNINVTGNYTPRSNTYASSITLFAFSSAGSNKFIGRVYYFRVYENGVLRFNAVPVRRDSDGVLGMYDLADSNPETAFHTNAGTGNFIAGEYKIKIATTKYSEAQFAPVETDLDAAVAAVDTVVTQTMSQAQAIDTIATSKQTRPDEGCPRFKNCLLVEDEDGTPHWYEIYDPINDFLRPILAATEMSGNQGAPVQTTHACGSDTCYDEYNGFFMGNGGFRKKYIDSSAATYKRPFGPTTLARCSVPVGEHTNTDMRGAGLCYNTGGMFRTLTEGSGDDAGEWALVWNGNEGGDSLGITPGVVYGIAKCTSVGQHTTEITGDVQSGSEYWWPKKLTGYNGGGTTLASLIEQYPNSNIETVFNTLPSEYGTDEKPGYPRDNFQNCWCKMTAIGVPGAGDTPEQRYANGSIMSVSGGWVFDAAYASSGKCAENCALGCAHYARAKAAFRRAVLTVK